MGVAHPYCGQTGKLDNCRVAIALSIATDDGSLPVGIPREWIDDVARCRHAGVLEEAVFETKPSLAMRQVEAALKAGYRRGVVFTDDSRGEETPQREQLAAHGLKYACRSDRERVCGGVSTGLGHRGDVQRSVDRPASATETNDPAVPRCGHSMSRQT